MSRSIACSPASATARCWTWAAVRGASCCRWCATAIRVCGVDLSPHMLARASKRLQRVAARRRGNALLVRGDLRALPVPRSLPAGHRRISHDSALGRRWRAGGDVQGGAPADRQRRLVRLRRLRAGPRLAVAPVGPVARSNSLSSSRQRRTPGLQRLASSAGRSTRVAHAHRLPAGRRRWPTDGTAPIDPPVSPAVVT